MHKQNPLAYFEALEEYAVKGALEPFALIIPEPEEEHLQDIYPFCNFKSLWA
ncbi:MAG: hypothetical protein RSB05_06720 [Clostridiales bacterium]